MAFTGQNHGMDISIKLEKLTRIGRTVSATLDISEVLKRSLELEQDVVDAETGSILLLDAGGEYLEFAVALGDAANILKNHRIRVGEGISGYVAQTRAPLLIPDVRQDKRFLAYFDSKTGFQTRSVLCVPIQTEDKLIGVAQAINRRDGEAFTEDDLVLFSAFAGTLGVAIENARIHKTLLDQEKIRQEITAARQVQESYLPRHFPDAAGYEFAGRLIPARQVSGDFYDAFRMPDGRVVILIGDVSGKGLPAALFMCRLLTEMRAALRHGQTISAALAAVNQQLCEQTTRGMFVTLIAFVLDTGRRKLIVANAGHLPFFMTRGGQWVEVLAQKNPPVGILPGRRLNTSLIDLPAGAQILAFTDGVTEARGAGGELFGSARLKELLERTRLTPRLLCDAIIARLDRYGAGAEPADDTTLVAFGCVEEPADLSFEILSHPAYLSLARDAAASVVGGRLESKGVSEIQVALSEAISNVIRHTYKNDQTQKIEIDMGLRGEVFEIVVRDYGPKVNPEKLVGRALEAVRPGGLGIHFMKTVFQDVTYDTSVEIGNRLILRRRVGGKTQGEPQS